MSFTKRMATLEKLTVAELTARRMAICDDPKNANPECAAGRSIYLYTPKARRQLDDLAWAIYSALKPSTKRAA